ncbi:hypothetical protein [Deinococcus roseus]|nr:hypothetical protein [Deinococcus roseus]
MHLSHPELAVLDVKAATEELLSYVARFADVVVLHAPGQSPHILGDPVEVFHRLAHRQLTPTEAVQVPEDLEGRLLVLLQQVAKVGSHVIFRVTLSPADPQVWECLVLRAYQPWVQRAFPGALEP